MKRPRPTSFKCSQCGRTLRWQVQQLIGNGNIPPPKVGDEMDGETIMRVMGYKPGSWHCDVKIGNWATIGGKRICTVCQAKIAAPPDDKSITNPQPQGN